MMSALSWPGALRQTLDHLPPHKHLPRIAVVGIGQELRGDDGVGPAIVRALADKLPPSPQLLTLDAGPAPENVTGTLRRFGPDLVVLVDAVEMDAPPGTVACVPWEESTGLSASTHTLPLTLLARYLSADLGCVVRLLGIQPARNLIGAAVSAEVRAAIGEVVNALCTWLLSEAQPT